MCLPKNTHNLICLIQFFQIERTFWRPTRDRYSETDEDTKLVVAEPSRRPLLLTTTPTPLQLHPTQGTECSINEGHLFFTKSVGSTQLFLNLHKGPDSTLAPTNLVLRHKGHQCVIVLSGAPAPVCLPVGRKWAFGRRVTSRPKVGVWPKLGV